MTRRYYTNVAPLLTLQSGIDSDIATVTLSIVGNTTGYPTSFPFIITLERATVNEEVVLCSAKTSNTFTVTRGWDGTTRKAHLAGATVEHTSAAADYNEANEHINDATLDHHTQYTRKALWTTKGVILVASGANTPVGVGVGANGLALVADSTQAAGVTWTTIGAAGIANGAVGFAKLDTATQQSLVQRVANTGAVAGPIAGQVVYDQAADRFNGYVTGGWAKVPHGIGKVFVSTGDPSGGVDGDLHLKYTA